MHKYRRLIPVIYIYHVVVDLVDLVAVNFELMDKLVAHWADKLKFKLFLFGVSPEKENILFGGDFAIVIVLDLLIHFIKGELLVKGVLTLIIVSQLP